MKTIYLFCFLLFSFAGIAQNKVILLKNKTTGIEKTVQEHKRINIITTDGIFVKGRVSIKNDTLLMVGKDSVRVGKIKEVQLLMTGTRVAGAVIKIGCGALLAINLAYAASYGWNQIDTQTLVYVIVGGGGLWIHSLTRSYPTDEWEIGIGVAK